MTQVEQDYEDRCLVLARDGEKALGRRVSRFRRMLSEHGAVEATRRLVNAQDPSDTFRDLWWLDRVGKWNRALDLTVEAVIVTETKWRELFEPKVIEAARQRLLDHEWSEETGRDN